MACIQVARLPRALAAHFHCFVRRDVSYVEVHVPDDSSVAALQEAVVAKFQLAVAPDQVRLLHEVKKGMPLVLDGRKTLKQLRLRPGASILVEVAPPRLEAEGAPMLRELPPRVMARGPDAHLDTRLLEALRDPLTLPALRLSALSELVRDTLSRTPSQGVAYEALPLYDTEAHRALLGVLLDHTRELMGGGFRGRNGLPCRTLVGERSIGKTLILRAFALVAASVFPGLIPLYITAASVQSPRTSFQVAPLDRFMALAAHQRGAEGGGAALETSLRSKGLRMLVLLDEADQLYRLQPGSAAADNVLFSLGTLSDLAEESTGEFGVLLCGSSSSTFKLVCGASSPLLLSRFPLSSSGAVLKSDKFMRVLLPSAPCTATGEVARMLAVMARCKDLPEPLVPLARLLTFFVGAKPRAVEAALLRGKDARVLELNLGLAVPAALTDGSLDSPAALALYHMVMALLVSRNDKLRALTGQSGGQASINSIMDPSTQWEAALVPLPWDTVMTAWAKGKGRVATEGDVTELAVLLDDLTDRHILHRRHTPAGVEVWPVTAAQLVASTAGAAWLRSISAEALRKLAPLAQLLQAASSVATVAGVIL